jgi:enoyl-CoA hydratase/carnithine racemase
MTKNYSTIKVEQKQNIAWITLSRPEKLNAINQLMLQELLQAVDQINEFRKIRCVVITGEGNKAFSVGADLTELKKLTKEKAADFSIKGQYVFSKIEALAKPVIAVINGYALGGGLELALACDFRIATENSELGCPEVKLGFLPAWGGTQRLCVVVGVSDAKRLIIHGDSIRADEALRIGLVDKIISSNRLKIEVEALAQRLSECPPGMVKHAKSAINSVTKTSFNMGFKRETEAFVTLFSLKETKEKIADFLSQRNKK